MKTIYSWAIFLGVVNKSYSSTGITFLNTQVCLNEMIANHLYFGIWNINQNSNELYEHLKEIWLLVHRSVTLLWSLATIGTLLPPVGFYFNNDIQNHPLSRHFKDIIKYMRSFIKKTKPTEHANLKLKTGL